MAITSALISSVSLPTPTPKRQQTTAAPKRQLAASFPVAKPHALTSEA